MSLIENEDSLKVGSVIVYANLLFIFSKTLNIYYRNLCLPGRSLLSLINPELLHKFGTRIGRTYFQSTSFKFLCSLFKKIETVNDKVKFGYLVLFGVKIV